MYRTGGEGSGGNQVTYCNACYYAREERPLPSECSNNLKKYRCAGLAGPKMKKCLKRWANCLKKEFQETFGKVRSCVTNIL